MSDTAITTWQILKWPLLVVLVAAILGLLYRVAPNARQGGLRWVTPGGFLAVLLWLAASGAFALYLANVASYNRTYGSLAGAIVFLVWLWLSNLAVLVGAEFDAELERQRAIAAGHPPDQEPYVQPRTWPSAGANGQVAGLFTRGWSLVKRVTGSALRR
jgi:membrane protein